MATQPAKCDTIFRISHILNNKDYGAPLSSLCGQAEERKWPLCIQLFTGQCVRYVGSGLAKAI